MPSEASTVDSKVLGTGEVGIPLVVRDPSVNITSSSSVTAESEVLNLFGAEVGLCK